MQKSPDSWELRAGQVSASLLAFALLGCTGNIAGNEAGDPSERGGAATGEAPGDMTPAPGNDGSGPRRPGQ